MFFGFQLQPQRFFYVSRAMIKAVLFDLDGIIVDTLHYHYLAWLHMFNELGGSITEHSILLHEGRNSRDVLPLLIEEAGVSLPEDEWEAFIDTKRKYFRSIVRTTTYPYAFDVIEELRRRGFATALVTASALKNMRNALSEDEMRYFDFLITGDEVKRSKPFPDGYRAAMDHLGLTPEECVVIENAPLGIEAAKNAGMRCIAVETTLGREYLQAADVIVHDIRELLEQPELQTPEDWG
jgi:beta-phosphoglucomutase